MRFLCWFSQCRWVHICNAVLSDDAPCGLYQCSKCKTISIGVPRNLVGDAIERRDATKVLLVAASTRRRAELWASKRVWPHAVRVIAVSYPDQLRGHRGATLHWIEGSAELERAAVRFGLYIERCAPLETPP